MSLRFLRSMMLLFLLHTGCVGANEYTAGSNGIGGSLRDSALTSVAIGFISSLRALPDRYTADRGLFRFTDVASCFARDVFCWGNNPSSAYGYAWLPTRDNEGNTGIFSRTIKVGEDAAIVVIGRTPPPTSYFGFTPYVYRRASLAYPSASVTVFGSLSDTLNMVRIGYQYEPPAPEGSYSKLFALVMSANRHVADEIQDLLVQSGLDADAVNLMPIPAASPDNPLYLGYGDEADSFSLVLRALPTHENEALEAYLSSAPFHVWRVNVRDPIFDSYDWTPYASRVTGIDEHVILPDVETRLENLVTAVSRRHPGQQAQIDPEPRISAMKGSDCIREYTSCGGDNQDALYFYLIDIPRPRKLTSDPANSWYIVGVNHGRTGKGTYTNHSVYRTDILAGIVGTDDRYAEGSAAFYAEAYADGLAIGEYDDFFVFRIARTCAPNEKALGYCVEVPYPDASNPIGAEDWHDLALLGRIYVEPVSLVGPAADEVVLPYLVVFE